MRRFAVALLAVSVAGVHRLPAQEVSGTPGPRLLLPRDREIALARSAAPPSVSSRARVWIFSAGTYVIADSGTSGVQCRVGRGWPQALEPHCFDEEGARTIMPIEMRKDELLHRGVSTDSVEREIAAGIAAGRYRLPQRPAMSWMLSAAQVLYDDNGTRVGAWRPHIMIYYPYLTPEGLGTGTNQDLAAGIVVSPGSPLSNIMIVVPKAMEPALDSSGSARSRRP
jgi:hypothetical protein